jgi:hypothetical protein
MHAGQRNIDFSDIWKLSPSYFDHRSPSGSKFDVIPELAGNLAGMAFDAPLLVKVETNL